MKKILCLLMVVALCLGFCACGTEELTNTICSGEWVCSDHKMDMSFAKTYDQQYISLVFKEDNTCQLRSERFYEEVFCGYETKTCTWEIVKGKIVVDGTDTYEYVDGKLLGSSMWDASFTFTQKQETESMDYNAGECTTMWLVESTPLYRYTYNEYGEVIARTSGPESDYEHSYNYEYLFNDDQTLREVRTFRDDKIYEVLLFDENGNICKSYEFDDFGHLEYICEYTYREKNVYQLLFKQYDRNMGQDQRIDPTEWSGALFSFYDSGAFHYKNYCADVFDMNSPYYSVKYTPEGEREGTLVTQKLQETYEHYAAYDTNGNMTTLYARRVMGPANAYTEYSYSYVSVSVSALQKQIMEAKARADVSDLEKFERDVARDMYS